MTGPDVSQAPHKVSTSWRSSSRSRNWNPCRELESRKFNAASDITYIRTDVEPLQPHDFLIVLKLDSAPSCLSRNHLERVDLRGLDYSGDGKLRCNLLLLHSLLYRQHTDRYPACYLGLSSVVSPTRLIVVQQDANDRSSEWRL